MDKYFTILNIDCIFQSQTAIPRFPCRSYILGGRKRGDFFHDHYGGTDQAIIRRLVAPVELHAPVNPLDEKACPHSLNILEEVNGKIGLHSLPPELHSHIFTHLTEYLDVLTLSCSSLYLWFVGYHRLTECLPILFGFGSWTGDRLSCCADSSQLWSENVLTPEELDIYNVWAGVEGEDNDQADSLAEYFINPSGPSIIWSSGLTSHNRLVIAKRLGYPDGETLFDAIHNKRGFLRDDSYLRKICFPWLDFAWSDGWNYCLFRLAEGDTWTLRNLSKKEYVRADVLDSPIPDPSSPNSSEDHAVPSTTHLEPWGVNPYYPINLGQVVLCRIISATDNSSFAEMPSHMRDNLVKGHWAGDRFDIVPFSKYQDQILNRGSTWKDVSEEVRNELVQLAEFEGISFDRDY